MNQEVNSATKGRFVLIAGIFCALGGCCVGRTMGEAVGTSVVGAVIGFVVGYAGALISSVLGFGLILVSAIAFWHSYTVWFKPAPPEVTILPIEESSAAIRRLKAKNRAQVNVQQEPRPSATPTPNKVE